jgi:hypothetical protein
VPDIEGTEAMLNPLQTEDEAFRFLLYTIVVLAVIAVVVLLLRTLF